VARLDGEAGFAEYMAYARGPAMPNGQTRVTLTVKKKRLYVQLYLGNKAKQLMTPVTIPTNELSGRFAIWPRNGKLRLSEVHLRGTIDKSWRKEEAARLAKTELEQKGFLSRSNKPPHPPSK
jgi:hypothetical protein